VASWLFFRVARSSRIDSDMLVVSASAARTALKNSQLTDGESPVIYGTGRWDTNSKSQYFFGILRNCPASVDAFGG
jgi:hypothetical protein